MLVKELAQCRPSVEVGGWVGGRVSLAKPECSLSTKRVDIYVLELSVCNNSQQMADQIDWREKQPSQEDCVSEDQKY